MNEIMQRLLKRIAFVAPGGYTIRPGLHRLRGVKIGKRVWISQNVYIDELHPESISIGDNTTLGIGSLIIAHLYWGPRRNDFTSKTIIGSGVFIGPNCILLPNISIGDGSVIQAGTVVNRDIPPQTLWGNAKSNALARVTVPLTHDSSYEKFVRGLRPIHKE